MWVCGGVNVPQSAVFYLLVWAQKLPCQGGQGEVSWCVCAWGGLFDRRRCDLGPLLKCQQSQLLSSPQSNNQTQIQAPWVEFLH